MDDMGKFILEKLDKIDDKVDHIKAQGLENKIKLEEQERSIKKTAEECESINGKLGEYNDQLRVHIDGVNTLKDMHLGLKKEVAPVVEQYKEDQAVTKYFSKAMAKRLKLLSLVSVVIGIIYGAIKLYTML